METRHILLHGVMTILLTCYYCDVKQSVTVIFSNTLYSYWSRLIIWMTTFTSTSRIIICLTSANVLTPTSDLVVLFKSIQKKAMTALKYSEYDCSV